MRSARTTKLRAAGVGLAIGAIAVLFAACGNGSVSPGVASIGSTTTTSPSSAVTGGSGGPPSPAESKLQLKLVTCLRSHGVPNMPDPLPSGGFSRSALEAAAGIRISGQFPASDLTNLASPRFDAALKACSSIAIASGFEHTPAEIEKHVQQETAEDQCIRKHGVPTMPDPNAQGQQSFPPGITPTTPQFEKAQKACAYLNP